MKTMIRLILAATAIFVVAVVLRVTSTVFFEGIDHEGYTVYGESRYVEMSGDIAREVILDMLHREPDLMIDSEERVYKNGDVLAWELRENGDHECIYRVSYESRLLAGMTFRWTVKGLGPCPLESL